MSMYKEREYEFLVDHLDGIVPCIVCDSQNWSPFAKKGFFEALKCQDCGMVSVNPYLTDIGVDMFYEKYFTMRTTNDPLFKVRHDQYLYDLDFLEKTCVGGSVLDIGCSGGYFLSNFSNKWVTRGLELTDDSAKTALELFNIPVDVCHVRDYEPLAKFDVVMARGVIEHFKNPRELTDRLSEFLNPGGHFYICATPTSDNAAFDVYRGEWRLFTPYEHVHFFNAKNLGRLLGPQFELVALDFPYEGTPYANPEEDMASFKQAYTQSQLSEDITAKSNSFPGAMMNAIWRYLPDG